MPRRRNKSCREAIARLPDTAYTSPNHLCDKWGILGVSLSRAYRSAAGFTALAACAAIWAGPVWAQTTKAPTAATATTASSDTAKDTPTTVTITGKKAETNKIDRQVYDVTKNADAQTGTAADALNKVPGVTVDPSGNVTLQGRNVRIFLNGRPSLMLSGDNRAVALQAMPSAYLSSIEVISNPGAQYASGSSDPIINIVTQRKPPPGLFGSVTVRANSTGRGQANTWMSMTDGKLSLSGFVSLYGNRQPGQSGSDLKALDTAGNLTAETQSHNLNLSHGTGIFAGPNGEYDFDLNDILTGGVTYNRGTGDWSGEGTTHIYDATGQATDLHTSASVGQYMYQSQGLTVGFTHYGTKPDEKLKIDGSYSSTHNTNDSRNEVTYALSPIASNTGTRVDTKSKASHGHNVTLSADYNTPIDDDQLAVGSQIVHDDSRSLTQAFGPDALGSALTPETLLDDDFAYQQTVSAAYGTYQREFGDSLTILGGLRAEALDLTTEDMAANTRSHISYVRLNPSVFGTWVFNPESKLRFNYVHRQHRPDASDLNPHLVFNSSNSVSLGNPRLQPQENDSFEGGYEYENKGLSYAVRGFFRRDDHLIASTSSFIPDPQNAGNQVIETTKVNFGHQTSDGLTANYNNRIGEKLTLAADATLTFSETRNPNIVKPRQGTSLGGSASVSYTFANKDQFFVNYKLTGKSFSGQGYTTAHGLMTVQYNHVLMPKLNLIVSLTDPLRTSKTESVTSTPLIHSFSMSSQAAPTFYVGLSKRFNHMFGTPTGS